MSEITLQQNSSSFANDSSETASEPKQEKRKHDLVNRTCKRIRRENPVRGLSDSCLKETEYYFENNLRKVYPYYFTYTTHCKGRWVGRRLLDVFSEEFRAHSVEEYKKNIIAGNIKINGETIDFDYVFKDNDLVTNTSHRHETPVAAAPIKIIHQKNDVIVINKPPSIPVHPCGRYRHNCLLFILAKEHNLTEVYSVHRLDRLTSGVLLLTKTVRRSQEINEEIRERSVSKEYVCRVLGEFPLGKIECNEPIDCISPKMGVCIVTPKGKQSQTFFERMSYNGKSSVVKCMPKTGRMHQIRVHLQYLGYPIMNDPIYDHTVFGPGKGKNGDYGKSTEQLIEDLGNTHNLQKWLLDDGVSTDSVSDTSSVLDSTDENRIASSVLEYYTKADGFQDLAGKYVKEPQKLVIDNNCDLCSQRYKDPEPKDLILFLHAIKYKGEGWEFESELPIWAKPDWDNSKL